MFIVIALMIWLRVVFGFRMRFVVYIASIRRIRIFFVALCTSIFIKCSVKVDCWYFLFSVSNLMFFFVVSLSFAVVLCSVAFRVSLVILSSVNCDCLGLNSIVEVIISRSFI